ncbi:MAG: chemotaxis protein CheW [Eubacterium sp.]|nr:chemotaxis protein CheW [Eubacterium sp.]MCM1215737.1 chemotaxis protein CheW [Lachnospiraceae bacterium]MCM1304372.1 chemotaxis protein CheW [Butyrivibrio sp.]MCM1343836.1 chemotaxis protein CheW [Muribaculaceae bacterium]MCM1238301.1 chemotaxis protein CheW [Lachnospiraceae bacterium]
MSETAEITEITENARGHDDQKDKYMTFKSGKEHYALKIQYVSEIIPFQAITAIPETEDYIKGLINLRGKILPVIDVRLRFKQAPFEYNDRTCIIVIMVRETMVGLVVEQIAEVVEIAAENILPPPTIMRGDKIQNKYVYGIGRVGDTVKLLIDPDKLLNDDSQAAGEQAGDMVEEDEREV